MSRIPYEGTKVPWTTTEGQIKGLLYEKGAIGVQWSEYKGDSILQFIYEVQFQGVKKEIGFEMRPPRIMKTKGRGRDKVKTWAKNESYRALYWYIKSKLEAIEYGIADIVREFQANVLLSLQDGSKTVLGNVIENYLEKDALNSLPYYTEKKDPKIVEVEAESIQ